MELLAGNCAHMTFGKGGSLLITDYRSSRAIERAQPQILHFYELCRRELQPAMALSTSRAQSSTFSSSFGAGPTAFRNEIWTWQVPELHNGTAI